MLEGVGTQTFTEVIHDGFQTMKNHTPRIRVSESILPTLYCWTGWPFGGWKAEAKKSSFMLRCCIITGFPPKFPPFHFQNHQKNGTWHVTCVTCVTVFHRQNPPVPSKAYYNVYRDQGLRQASFRLIGQTLTPFFNDTDLDAGRAYGYQAPERGRWEVGGEDWMLGKFLGKQTIRIWINVWWKAVILWYVGLHSCFSGGIVIGRLQGWFCVFEESPS